MNLTKMPARIKCGYWKFIVTIQAFLEGKTIWGKTIQALSVLIIKIGNHSQKSLRALFSEAISQCSTDCFVAALLAMTILPNLIVKLH
jgi:hypothetical protein